MHVFQSPVEIILMLSKFKPRRVEILSAALYGAH